MIFNKHLQTPIGDIYLWEVANYSARISAGEKKRLIERSEVRLKLNSLGYDNEIEYKTNGQPYLKDLVNTFLSISHSNGFMAIYISSERVGIDIECERKSMLDGRSYFVNPEEELQELSQERLHLIWGAKETFYKQLEGQIEDLKNDVTVFFYDPKKKNIHLRYQNKVIELKFEIFKEVYLVFS